MQYDNRIQICFCSRKKSVVVLNLMCTRIVPIYLTTFVKLGLERIIQKTDAEVKSEGCQNCVPKVLSP